MVIDNLIKMLVENSNGKENRPYIIIVPSSPYLDHILREGMLDEDDVSVEIARELARIAHEGQLRISGEPYFNHLVQTVENMQQYNPTSRQKIVGWLHDIREDTDITNEFLRILLGSVAYDIEIMNKNKPKELREHKTKRHWLYAFFDPNIALASISERLDNMRTIEYLPEPRQIAIALETLNIVVPIAYHHNYDRHAAELEYLSKRILGFPQHIKPPEKPQLRYIS